MRANGRQRGFTLIELLIVIAIMGTLLTIAVFQTRTVLDRQNVEKTIKSIHADLMAARVRAMQKNRLHFVFVDLPFNTLTVYEDTNTPPEGNGTLEAQWHAAPTDFIVSQQNLMPKYPAVWDFANPFTINEKGLIDEADLPTVLLDGSHVGTIRIPIPSEASGSVDCLQITQLKATMGRWISGECIPQ